MKSHIGVYICVGLLVLLATSVYYYSRSAEKITLTIHGTPLVASVADTAALRERGLSGHKRLADNEAMLFVFDDVGVPGFWMKDMLFSIDILWLDSSKRVVSVVEDISPATFPHVFYPPSEAQYVLEMQAQNARRIGIQVGDVAVW